MTPLLFSPCPTPKAPLRTPVTSDTSARPDPVHAESSTPAPIALFLYHRPQHTLRCLQSLASNPEFLDSPLYLFCDGAKGQADAAAVKAVQRIARELPHPHKQVIEAGRNRGLASSVIAGVTQVVQTHGRVVVVEDDLVLAPTFLAFMNRALDRYVEDQDVMQISGHMVPVDPGNDHDAVFLPMACSWGWATWARAWHRFDPTMRDFTTLQRQPGLRRQFDLGGAYPYFSILQRQRAGRADSWFIRWYLSLFMQGGMVLYPRQSLVRNDGFDGTGVHCGPGGSPYDPPGHPPHLQLTRLPPAHHVDAHALGRVRTYLAARNTLWQRARRRLQALLT
jgi:hypothetical protein